MYRSRLALNRAEKKNDQCVRGESILRNIDSDLLCQSWISRLFKVELESFGNSFVTVLSLSVVALFT